MPCLGTSSLRGRAERFVEDYWTEEYGDPYARLQREARRRGLTVPDLVSWLLVATRDVEVSRRIDGGSGAAASPRSSHPQHLRRGARRRSRGCVVAS